MRRDHAHALWERNHLPSRETSRRVLEAIVRRRSGDYEKLLPGYEKQLQKLERDYFERVARLGPDVRPQNVPFYQLLRDRYPGLEVRDELGQLQIECYFNGLKPNLLSLLLGLIPAGQVRSSPRTSCFSELERYSALPDACRRVFAAEGIAPISGANLTKLLHWIEAGRAGEESNILVPVCPDYASEADENGSQRYTFTGVNSGIGIAGQRVYRSLPSLIVLFQHRLGFRNIKLTVSLGDCECFNEETARRMGMSVSEFRSKILESEQALREEAPVPATATLFSKLFGGHSEMVRQLKSMRERFSAGEFSSLLQSSVVRDIAHGRRSLYRRWLGQKKIEDEILYAMVLMQGVECALLGAFAETKMKNALLLIAGDPRWTEFYRAASKTPVLFLGAEHL